MRLLHIKLQFNIVYNRHVPSIRTFSSKLVNIASKKYADTLLLPKTNFPQRIPAKNIKEHETTVAANCQFENLYGLQRLWRAGQPEFILHDGPPYANGDAHIGHAVNKILKDITNRHKLLCGYQVNYIPGWDCHGLPIELKAMKDKTGIKGWVQDPLAIRTEARKAAQESIDKQMQSFRRWGIMAEWKSAYKSFDKNYIKAELQLFYELFQKGFVYRGLKPVFWSPTSRSALAEAELEYNTRHASTAVYLSLPLCSDVSTFASKIGMGLPPEIKKEHLQLPVNAVIWTTTPWSLPGNAAIAYNDSLNYTLVHCHTGHGVDSAFHIVATECLPEFRKVYKHQVESVFEFQGSKLEKFQYKHPWFEDTMCPFLHGTHVTTEKGTGLVHTAPAHGQDDYVLGIRHNLPINCYINDDGVFDDSIKKLKGMTATSLATSKIIRQLDKQILSQGEHIHSYPYDWRTKKPVLMKTSMQWFINTDKIKTAAVEALSNISIYPKNIQNNMASQLVNRPYWCISRQRSWGVPIPVLYHKETKDALVHKGVIDRLCDLVELTGSVDAWWEVPVGTLIQNDDLASQYEKGKDIFDIWLDSGLSWHMLGDKVADLYLEGMDQFNGWFHSSLITSIALRGVSPYKNLYVHGFVVDESGKKMSKSLGNVMDPNLITDGGDSPALGADTLRWWCATQGSSESTKIAISNTLLQLSESSVQKLRNTLRFLVSFCTTNSLKELVIDDVTYDELMYIDQYMLSLLRTFRQQTMEDYDNYNYHRVMNRTLHFVATEVSSYYLTWIKDRLYCDYRESQSRKSCIFVLNQIYLTLARTLAPVLPYLCEEAHFHYSNGEESLFKSTWDEENPEWESIPVAAMMTLALDVRATVNQISGSENPKTLWVQIICNETAYQTLQMLHPTNCSEADKCTSELCDILQVSGIDLRCSENKNFTIETSGVGHSLGGFSAAVGKTEMFQCHRCRRYCCTEGTSLCSRCQSVINRLQIQPPQNSEPPVPKIPEPEPVKEEILIRS